MEPFGTTWTRASIASNTSGEMAAAHPVTMTRARSFARNAPRTALRVFFSASPVTVHVFTMTRSADFSSTASPPRASRAAVKSSLSTRLTLQPKLTT